MKGELNSFGEYSELEIIMVSIFLLGKIQMIIFLLIFIFYPVSVSQKRNWLSL